MTIRNLDATFAPTSIALVGASPRPGSVGRVVLQNVQSAGFSGPVYPVNIKYDEVLGLRCYGRIADLPEAPELAVIMTPPETVPGIVGELGARGTKVVVVITAGIGTANGLRQRMLDAANPHLLRIIGPNTIGLLAPHARLNASFVHISPGAGRLGLISQSGAIVSSVIDWAAAEGIGFSQVYSLGDMADVDVGDCLNMLAADEHTGAILMYLESIPAGRKFMSAARAAARVKPVIAVKPGRHAAAAKAALTHTGALAGADRVVDAALRRAGVIRVRDLDDLFNAAEITARYKPLQQGRIAIVTNGGGAGVLAVDELLDQGCTLASLSETTLTALDKVLPATWSRANPVDIIGDAPPERYRSAVEAMAADPGVDAILVMNCPTGIADPVAAATAVANIADGGTLGGKPILACWLGKKAAEPARMILQGAGVGSFDTPSDAAEAVALLTRWSELRRQLERVPSSQPQATADPAIVNKVLAGAIAEGRSLLTEAEAKEVLKAYGIEVPETVIAASPDEVYTAATDLITRSDALVVKMLSKTVSHKSDVGGVVLGLTSPEGARQAAAEITRRFEQAFPGRSLDGFTVQPMIRRPDAVELIAGIGSDPIFGSVVVFGAGGTSVEVVNDSATGLVPIDDVLAADLIDRTRVSRLLAGYRDTPAADRAAIIATLVALSQLAIDFPLIGSIDINPLLADADGVIALDARIEIDPARVSSGRHGNLSIRPYPSGWSSRVAAGGQDYLLRPIRPEDVALYPAFLARMDREDMRLRFLTPTPTLSHDMLVRLTQLDYDRDIAFIALQPGTGELAGIVRYSADPDHITAEFGVLVRSDLKGAGLGRALMKQLITYARSDGIAELVGLVLRENGRMLALCNDLGFVADHLWSDPALLRRVLSLRQPLSDTPSRRR